VRNNGLPLLLIAFVLLFLGFWVKVDWFWHWPISQLNYERIRLGMSRDEVKDIMGEENRGDRSPQQFARQREGVDVFSLPRIGGFGAWFNKKGEILVHFDSQDQVVGKEFWLRAEPNFLDKTCAFLPLWSVWLAEAIGLLLIVYLCVKWIKKYRRRNQVYAPTVTIPPYFATLSDASD